MSIRPVHIPGVPEGVEVRRSDRRKRSVAAFREGDQTIVVIPARMGVAEAAVFARDMVAKLEKRDARLAVSDDELSARAIELSARYLPGAPEPRSVTWSQQQNTLWGSCTSIDGTIRISHRVMRMPKYVLDYVLLHELAHLLVTDHGPRFDHLVARYPERDRATAFLDGVEFARANLPANG